MKPPATESELLSLLAGGLTESAALEVKQELSDTVTKAITGLSVDGGMLLVGIAEVDGRPTRLQPLAHGNAAKDTLARMVDASVRPTLSIHVDVIDVTGGSVLVVVVPPSTGAPHQYFKKGSDQGKFYGRDDSGNRILAEDEVERLMLRRNDLRARERRLPGDLPLPVIDVSTAELVVRIQPTLTDDGLLAMASGGHERTQKYLEDRFRTTAADELVPVPRMPDGARFLTFARSGGWHPTFSGWVHGLDTSTWERESSWDEVSEDGTFTSRGAIRIRDGQVSCRGIVDHLARSVHLVGSILDDGGYYGSVDVAVRLAGLRGARLMESRTHRPFADEEYLRTSRDPAVRLRTQPLAVTEGLLRRLLEVGLSRPSDLQELVDAWRDR